MTPILMPSVFTPQELCREQWVRADLIAVTSARAPLWDGKSKMRARIAMEDEAARVAAAAGSIEPSNELLLAYHVKIDEAPVEDPSNDAN